jgi:hypothetical protein
MFIDFFAFTEALSFQTVAIKDKVGVIVSAETETASEALPVRPFSVVAENEIF